MFRFFYSNVHHTYSPSLFFFSLTLINKGEEKDETFHCKPPALINCIDQSFQKLTQKLSSIISVPLKLHDILLFLFHSLFLQNYIIPSLLLLDHIYNIRYSITHFTNSKVYFLTLENTRKYSKDFIFELSFGKPLTHI